VPVESSHLAYHSYIPPPVVSGSAPPAGARNYSVPYHATGQRALKWREVCQTVLRGQFTLDLAQDPFVPYTSIVNSVVCYNVPNGVVVPGLTYTFLSRTCDQTGPRGKKKLFGLCRVIGGGYNCVQTVDGKWRATCTVPQ
jgi:hypothetical protein